MVDVALRTRDRQRADTHRRIFDAAAHHLRMHGVTGTSVAAVAKAAGVSRQTFYDHFPTLDDVVAEAFADYRDRVAAHLASTLDRRPDRDLADLLDALIEALFHQMEPEDSQLRLEIAAHLVRGVDARPWLDEPLFRIVADAVAAARRDGEVVPDLVPDDLTRSLLTAVGGFLLIESESPADRARRARQTIHLVLRGAAP
jgi:AcrR family transcriptional regulator